MHATKNVTVGEHEYQIRRLSAFDGSWLVAQIMTKLLPTSLSAALGKLPESAIVKTDMTRAEVLEFQQICLGVVDRWVIQGEQRVAMPILAPDQRWVFKDLEYDAVTVLALTGYALAYNATPFLEEGALNKLLASVQDLIPSNASK